jgi:hypothetical protein
LQPQLARLLALLVSRAGELVLRAEIKAHLWGEDTFVDFERGLNFCILQGLAEAQLKAICAAWLNRLEQASIKRWVSPYQMAVYALWLDQPDVALARLHETYEARVGMMGLLATDPAMDALRGDARFQALAERVKTGPPMIGSRGRR